ncbi:MAG: class II glutamine amidotransferase [Acidobacteriota bacterium]
MCELFVMSSRLPATVTYSLEEFARHGGGTGPHSDGWGIAYYEDRDASVIRDLDPAATSPLVRCVADRGLRSGTVISHIRHATQGAVALRNTQPFAREVGGRIHLFAHNGDLESIASAPDLELGVDRPLGETDSELAFCALLARLRPLWKDGLEIPLLEKRTAVVVAFARTLRPLGPANFIYFDGDVLFLHGHRRKHDNEEEPRTPGLNLLCRSCAVDGSEFRAEGLEIAGGNQHVVLAASVPLTDEPWQPFAEGEIVVVRGGEIIERHG